MKTTTSLCLLACLAAFFVSGCQTSPYKKGTSLSAGLQKASTEVQNESAAIKTSMEALSTLVNSPSGDLRIPFQAYVQALKQLETAAVRTARTGVALDKKGHAHLAAWDQQMEQMNFEAVKNQSGTRREAVSSSLQTVNQRYQEAAEAVNPLISYLQDIRRALNADLTVEGLQAVKSIEQNAQTNANRVETALGNLRQQLDDLSRRLSAGQETETAPAKPAAA